MCVCIYSSVLHHINLAIRNSYLSYFKSVKLILFVDDHLFYFCYDYHHLFRFYDIVIIKYIFCREIHYMLSLSTYFSMFLPLKKKNEESKLISFYEARELMYFQTLHFPRCLLCFADLWEKRYVILRLKE